MFLCYNKNNKKKPESKIMRKEINDSNYYTE